MKETRQQKPQSVLAQVLGDGFGQVNALIKNVMRQTGTDDPNETIRLVNAGEYVVVPRPRRWREENGIIYFSVTTNGMTGEEWIKRLEGKKYDIGQYAKSVLLSKDFQPMAPGVTIEVAVLKGELFANNDRTPANIRADAERRKFGKPNAEIACLIRDQFTNKEIVEMGLYEIVAMHDPIKDSGGVLRLLGAYRPGRGCDLLAFGGDPGNGWFRGSGFAFLAEQVA